MNETEEVLENGRTIIKAFNSKKKRQEGERLLEVLPQGEGSSLDADMVDGKHADDIVEDARKKIVLKATGSGGGLSVSIADDRYVNVSGDTMIGTLNTQHITPVTDNTYNVGSPTHGLKSVFVKGGGAAGSLVLLDNSGTPNYAEKWFFDQSNTDQLEIWASSTTHGGLRFFTLDASTSLVKTYHYGAFYNSGLVQATTIKTNSINELTEDAGVIIENVRLEDAKVYFSDVYLDNYADGYLGLKYQTTGAYKNFRCSQFQSENWMCMANSGNVRTSGATALGNGQIAFQGHTGAAWQTAAQLGTAGNYDPTFYIPRAGDITMLAAASLDCSTNGGYFKPRRLSQAAQPTPDTNELLVWRDTDDDKTYLVYEDPDVGTRKIEMT